MIKPLVALPPLIFAGLAAVFFVGMQRENPDELPSTLIGASAPGVNPAQLAGYPTVDAEALANGDYTLVNFWASWCPPCRAEHPQLMRLRDSGVRILGVNMKDDADDAASFLKDGGNPFDAVSFDHNGRTSIDWGVTAPPETFVIDGEGKVIYRFIGPLIGTDYEKRFVPQLSRAQGNG